MCISSRHLAFLMPQGAARYAAAASTHLQYALVGFRSGISRKDLACSRNVDLFMSAALLLQFELWAGTEHFANGGDPQAGPYDPKQDSIFAYSASLKNTLMECFKPEDVHSSIIMTHLANDGTLADSVEVSAYTAKEYQKLFAQPPEPTLRSTVDDSLSSFAFRPKNSSINDDNSSEVEVEAIAKDNPYAPIISALIPLLACLPSSHALSPVPTFSIARHILCFPFLCRGFFSAQASDQDPYALHILYYFFHATRILLTSDDFWWAKKRAAAIERTLENDVGKERSAHPIRN